MSTRFLCIGLAMGLYLQAEPACVDQLTPDFASLERQIWQAYYDRDLQKTNNIATLYIKSFFDLDDNKAVELTPEFLKIWEVFHSIQAGAPDSAYNTQVLPLLKAFLKKVAASVAYKLNIEEAAQKELAWWVARRNTNTRNIENVAKLMAQAMSATFGNSPAEYERMAYLRAAAIRFRDKCQNEWGGIRSEDWQTVEDMLRQAYDIRPSLPTQPSKGANETPTHSPQGHLMKNG